MNVLKFQEKNLIHFRNLKYNSEDMVKELKLKYIKTPNDS